jgi:HEAT repeat protein
MDEHLERLIDGLGSKDGMARTRARETLVLVGDSAAPRLRALLAGADKRLRWEAIKTLAAIVDTGSLDEFLGLLDDPDSDLRWLAATGLTKLGPRSARPVLHALTEPSLARGRLEMSRRILGELSADNKVLAEILSPLMQVIVGNDPAVINARAARALADLDGASGRPPDPALAPPASV